MKFRRGDQVWWTTAWGGFTHGAVVGVRPRQVLVQPDGSNFAFSKLPNELVMERGWETDVPLDETLHWVPNN